MKLFSAPVVLLLLIQSLALKAQTLTNSCSEFMVTPGAVFYVNGDFVNKNSGEFSSSGETTVNGHFVNNGVIYAAGTLNVKGDITNNNVFFPVAGTVILNGGNQTIKGFTDWDFYNLQLGGSGIKLLRQIAYVRNLLDISSVELALDTFSVLLDNPDVNSLIRTTGFISTNLYSMGRIYRKTASQNTYLFPLGSSAGTARYRPVEITPYAADTNGFYVSFTNQNPGLYGKPVTSNDGSFCNLNNQFFHTAGVHPGSAKVSVYFNPADDGFYSDLAIFYGVLWQSGPAALLTSGLPLSCVTIDSVTQNHSDITLANSYSSLTLPADTAFCSGGSVTINAGSGYSSYLWSNGATTDSITATTAGMYYVTVTSGPCTISDSILVSEIPAPLAFAGNDTTICQGAGITLTASGGSSYLWSNGSTSPSLTLTPSASVSLSVTVTDNGCSASDNVNITVAAAPVVFAGNDTTIYQGQSITLVPAFSGSISTYAWTPASYLSNAAIPSPVASPPVTTTYTLAVSDANGCSSSGVITITVVEDPNADIIIYNTFTPNTDGVNDTWFIENIDHFPENELQIFNRNGHLVYEKTGYNNEWDGKYYGNELPSATYYYVLDLKDGRILKGDVTIIR
jgi:gliding motility-associated-like protein